MKQHKRSIWDDMMRWKESIWKENCPFCIFDDGLIIWQWKYLNIRHNKYPYNWLENHLLLVPNRHIEHTEELDNDELIEFRQAEKFLHNYYWDVNYFSFIRHTNWWKSIRHIHYHYIPWTIYSKKLETILTNN